MTHNHFANIVRLGFLTLAVGSLTLFFFQSWIRMLRRARLVEDMGSSTARAVAQGYVEVVGTQHPVADRPLVAPLTGTPCTWWYYKVEEKRRSWADGGRRTEWVTLEEATSTALIVLKDATGQLAVNPKGAEVQPSTTDCWCSKDAEPASRPMTAGKLRDGRYRYTEKRMRPGDRMYVAGELHTFGRNGRADTHTQAVTNLLNRWRRDQGKLIERFDVDGNQRIDAGEWDIARTTAHTEVSSRLQARAVHKADVLCKPDDDQPFLLSTQAQPELIKRYRSQARNSLVAFGIGVAVTAGVIRLLWLIW